MLELDSSGSVRGVPCNGHPYRDPRATLAALRRLEHQQLGVHLNQFRRVSRRAGMGHGPPSPSTQVNGCIGSFHTTSSVFESNSGVPKLLNFCNEVARKARP